MFTIIRPACRSKNSALLSKIMGTRDGFYEGSLTQEDDCYDTPSTLYIAYEKKEWGVFASARLNLLSESPVASFYQDTFSPEAFKHTREVSLVSFRVEDDHWVLENMRLFSHALREFYQSLHEVLINLSVAHGFKGFVTLTDEDHHPDFIFFGDWPLITTQKLVLNQNPLVIGELPLEAYDRQRAMKKTA